MVGLKNIQEKRMMKIIEIYTQESGEKGWVLSTKELQGVYNDGLQKNKQIDIITAYNLTFELEEFLKRRYYIKHEYTQELDGAYVHYFALMECDEIKKMEDEVVESNCVP